MNLETGNYYSLGGSGVEIWRRIAAGCSFPATNADPPVNYHGEVRAFLDELEREKMIVPEDPGQESAEEGAWSFSNWVLPTIEKFTDMRDMLLTDPIHELDESGWPKPAPPDNT